jgi:NAD(P)-dependent dehydrogenase (short-subunit alcohol dehydrogenase family)
MFRYRRVNPAGRRALVFGGTSGIGQAIALALAKADAHVIPVSRRAEEVAKTAPESHALGHLSMELTANVIRRDEVRRAIQSMAARMGGSTF